MKIYVVRRFAWSYPDGESQISTIEKVFATEEAASKFVNEVKAGYGEYFEVEGPFKVES